MKTLCDKSTSLDSDNILIALRQCRTSMATTFQRPTERQKSSRKPSRKQKRTKRLRKDVKSKKPFKLMLGLIIAWIVFFQYISWMHMPALSPTSQRSMFSDLAEWNSRHIDSSKVVSHSPVNGMHQNGTTLMSTCAILPTQGPELMWGYQALVKVELIDLDSELQKLRELLQHPSDQAPKLLCVVLTDSTRHKDVLPAILATYAPKCTGFIAISNQTDASLRAVNHPTANDTAPATTRQHQAMQYVHQHLSDKYEFFHFVGDDAYIIPEHLQYHVARISWNENNAGLLMYMGDIQISDPENPSLYCTIGSGITLNKASLDLVASHKVVSCMQAEHKSADQLLGYCLAQHSDIKLCQMGMDPDGSSLYHEYGPNHASLWLMKQDGPPIYGKVLRSKFGITIRNTFNRISNTTVSFHLMDGLEPMNGTTADLLHRVHAIIYGLCNSIWNKPLGALDASGQGGYIHDPEYVKHHPLPLTTRIPRSGPSPGETHVEDVCNQAFGTGLEGGQGYLGLQKIKAGLATASSKRNIGSMQQPQPRILCMIYTHSGSHHKIRAIAETYGSRCDGFMAASNVTDPTIGAVNLLHEGPESYDNMWLKVRAIWQYAHDHYLDKYDFFHLGGDDHYVIAEHLRHVAGSGSWKGAWNQSAPLFFGGTMVAFPYTRKIICGGGSGYTLNTHAVKLLVEELFDKPDCWPHWLTPKEDYIIAGCFRLAGINCADTNDERNETRYHQGGVNYHAKWQWGQNGVWRAVGLRNLHGIASMSGLGQISETSISFHLKLHKKQLKKLGHWDDLGIRRYDAILYDRCPNMSSIVKE